MSSKAAADQSRRRPLARIDVRLTLWSTAIFLLTALLLFGLTFANLYQTLRDQDRQELQIRALGYVLRFRSAAGATVGLNHLVNEIGNEMLQPSLPPVFVRIATTNNQTVFLGIPLAEWHDHDIRPLTMSRETHTDGFMTLHGDRPGYDLEVLAVTLGSDLVLQVGSSTENRFRITAAFQRSFLATFAVMLAISVAGGLFFTGRTLRPIGSLNHTIQSIVDTGELSRRIPSPNTRDDLDDMTHSFNAMLDRIERLVTGLRDALDSVAHDLRTPLTRLRNTAERALSREGGEDDYREALSDVMEESERIVAMLNAMMDLSEAESGAMNLNLGPVDLSGIASNVADVYAIVAEEREIAIEFAHDHPVVVRGDAARLRQVVGNLYDNAIKYGRSGSVVRVLTRYEEEGIDGARTGVMLVTNSGVGIQPDDIDRIWSRFYRGGEPGTRGHGLGLGLALVRAIVQAHGGDVGVWSEPGETTTFRIAVPADLSKV